MGIDFPAASLGLFHCIAVYPLPNSGPIPPAEPSSIEMMPPGYGLLSGVKGKIPVANFECISKYLNGLSNTVFEFTLMVILFDLAPVLVVINTTPLPALEP